MRLALISVSAEDETGHRPVGMLPLFDGNIIEKQVKSAQNMGAEKIILLSAKMHAGLLSYLDVLKFRDIDAEIVRDADDLGRYASPEDDLIFLGDGIFPGKEIENHLVTERDELIYVVANADMYSGFERIDLNHRWLGIALLNASHLVEISQIPAEWDIGSALLRTAVQSGCSREVVADADMQEDAVLQLINSDMSASYAHRQLDNINIPAQNFLDRYIVWPLMRMAMPFLWKARDAKRYTSLASVICAAMALGFGFINWDFISPVISLLLLMIGALSLLLYRRISIFSFDHGKRHMIGPIFYLLGAATLTVIVARNAPAASLFADMAILAILFGNLWITHTTADNGRLSWIKPDVLLILSILLIAGGLGLFSMGLYFSALVCTAYLVAAHSRQFAPDLQVDRVE